MGGFASIQSGGVPKELIPVLCTHNRLCMNVTPMKKLFSLRGASLCTASPRNIYLSFG